MILCVRVSISLDIRYLPAMQETEDMRIQSLSWEDPLEKEVATHSSILAWRIPWMEEPGGLSPKDSKEQDTNEATEHTRVQCDLK